MLLGMEVGLSPGDSVRWGPSYPQNTGHTHYQPVFGPYLLWPDGWMDEDATGTEVDLGPGHIVLVGVPALHETGTAAPPHDRFGPCLLWSRSPISATAELLLVLTEVHCSTVEGLYLGTV